MVPMEVLDEKNIYAPSRAMKSIQYLLDKGVVRVWNDAVLSIPDRNSLKDEIPAASPLREGWEESRRLNGRQSEIE